jgi:quinol-cytochrome oxidoreductase complex cytochrome b subunit
MNGVAFGWLIRGIHHWGATLMVVVVFVHLLRVFVTASFKYPRELTWLIGVGLLCLRWAGFTGTFAVDQGLLGHHGRHQIAEWLFVGEFILQAPRRI